MIQPSLLTQHSCLPSFNKTTIFAKCIYILLYYSFPEWFLFLVSSSCIGSVLVQFCSSCWASTLFSSLSASLLIFSNCSCDSQPFFEVIRTWSRNICSHTWNNTFLSKKHPLHKFLVQLNLIVFVFLGIFVTVCLSLILLLQKQTIFRQKKSARKRKSKKNA